MEAIVTSICTAFYNLIELFEANDLDKLFLPKGKRKIVLLGNKFGAFIWQIILIAIIGSGIYAIFGIDDFWLSTVATWLINVISIGILLIILFKSTVFCKRILRLIKKYILQTVICVWSILIISFAISILYKINFSALFVNNVVLSSFLASIYSIFLIIVITELVAVVNNKNESKYYICRWHKKYYLYYMQADGFVVYGTEKYFDSAKQFYFIKVEELKRKYVIHTVGD